jgi:hypothetical protein
MRRFYTGVRLNADNKTTHASVASGDSTAAHAYIGPGAGAGAVAVVLGILGSIVLGLIGVVWYPIKRLIKKRKSRRPGA